MTVVVFEMTLETVEKGKSRPSFPLQVPAASPLPSPLLPTPCSSPPLSFLSPPLRKLSFWSSFAEEGFRELPVSWNICGRMGFATTWRVNRSAYFGDLAFDRSVRSQLDKRPFTQSAEFIWPLKSARRWGPGKFCSCLWALFLLPLSFYLNMGPR